MTANDFGTMLVTLYANTDVKNALVQTFIAVMQDEDLGVKTAITNMMQTQMQQYLQSNDFKNYLIQQGFCNGGCTTEP